MRALALTGNQRVRPWWIEGPGLIEALNPG